MAEDHYLPFKHSNLKAMKGGTYVRSRTMGGLTTEDIRTGLLTGADKMVVVSHSGIFQVSFDPDFKKRNTARAKQMVDRYGKLLDAVQSEKVTKTPLSRREAAIIEEEVDDWAQQQLRTPSHEEKTAKFNELRAEAMKRPRLSTEEQQQIYLQARQGYSQSELQTEKAQREVRIAERELSAQKLQEKGERHYALNGQGYQAALETLQDEFPYFIKVERLQQASDVFGQLGMPNTDSGYVKPRFLHPEKEQHGYFGENIDSSRGKAGSKRRGDTTEYQNYRYNKKMRFLEQSDRDNIPQSKEGTASASGGQQQQSQNKPISSTGPQMPTTVQEVQQLRRDTPANAMANVDRVIDVVTDHLNSVQDDPNVGSLGKLENINLWNDSSETRKLALLQNTEYLNGLLDEAGKVETRIKGAAHGARSLRETLGGTYTSSTRLDTASPLLPMTFKGDDRMKLLSDKVLKEMYLDARSKFKEKSVGNDYQMRALSNDIRQKTSDEHRSRKVLAVELARYDIWNGKDMTAVEADADVEGGIQQLENLANRGD